MGFIADGFDVLFNIGPIAPQGFADVDDHVDFHRAMQTGLLGFVSFDLGRAAAVRKANHRTDANIGASKQFGGALDVVGFDADGSNVVFRRDLAAFLQFGVRHGRMQEGVIDHFRELIVCGTSSSFHVESVHC